LPPVGAATLCSPGLLVDVGQPCLARAPRPARKSVRPPCPDARLSARARSWACTTLRCRESLRWPASARPRWCTSTSRACTAAAASRCAASCLRSPPSARGRRGPARTAQLQRRVRDRKGSCSTHQQASARQGWGGGYLCQPHVPGSTWPDLFLQCALPWPPCSALPAARPRARSRPLAQPGKAGPGRSGFSNYPCAAACSRDALLQSGRSRREPQASRIGRPVHQAKPAAGAARARRRACGPHRAGRCAASGARCASACCAS